MCHFCVPKVRDFGPRVCFEGPREMPEAIKLALSFMVEGSDRIRMKRNFGAATYQLGRQT
jgi:hypothetical protein